MRVYSPPFLEHLPSSRLKVMVRVPAITLIIQSRKRRTMRKEGKEQTLRTLWGCCHRYFHSYAIDHSLITCSRLASRETGNVIFIVDGQIASYSGKLKGDLLFLPYPIVAYYINSSGHFPGHMLSWTERWTLVQFTSNCMYLTYHSCKHPPPYVFQRKRIKALQHCSNTSQPATSNPNQKMSRFISKESLSLDWATKGS